MALGFEIDATARIGLSLVLSERVDLGPRAQVGHLTLIKGLETLSLQSDAIIGNLNWIYAVPRARGFFEDIERRLELKLCEGASITSRHIVDCSDSVEIGRLALVAGSNTQILTHSVNLKTGRQGVRPIRVEEGAFVGSRSILLSGSVLPFRSALAAGSTLRNAYSEPYALYAGVFAVKVRNLDPASKFFYRSCSPGDGES